MRYLFLNKPQFVLSLSLSLSISHEESFRRYNARAFIIHVRYCERVFNIN